jgi:hypothetical protein
MCGRFKHKSDEQKVALVVEVQAGLEEAGLRRRPAPAIHAARHLYK